MVFVARDQADDFSEQWKILIYDQVAIRFICKEIIDFILCLGLPRHHISSDECRKPEKQGSHPSSAGAQYRSV